MTIHKCHLSEMCFPEMNIIDIAITLALFHLLIDYRVYK